MRFAVVTIILAALAAPILAQQAAHPRLLIDAADVPKLRERAKQEPYATIVQAMIAKNTALGDEPDAGLMYKMRPRNLATLYLLTGEAAYAKEAEQYAVRMVNDAEFWNNPGSKGLTRAAGALTVALAYDFCYDAWAPDTRALVSGKLRFAAEKLNASMGAGANTQVGNNWQAVRYGGAGMAALASDAPGGLEFAREAYAQLKRHLNANLGDNGWNPEGIGYTLYPWKFTGPFGIAAHRHKLGDLRVEVKKAALTHWTTLVGTVAIPRIGGLGIHGDLSDDNANWRAGGIAGMAFWYAPAEQVPALRWMYDYLCGARGDRSYDSDDGGGLYSILYYPDTVPAENPAKGPGLTYTDKSHGIAIFRNRYQDEDDIVALVNGHARQPDGAHGGSDTNTLRLLGLGSVWATGSGRTGDANGQTNLFPGPPATSPPGGLGALERVEFLPDGGGTAVTTGSCMGVKEHRRVFVADYSGAGGAPAVFLLADRSANGKLWRWNTPEFNAITHAGNRFTITAPTGATLVARVLEPQDVTFRTGTFRRDNPDDPHGTGFGYREQRYRHNRWIEFDCDRDVFMVLTLQRGAAPAFVAHAALHGVWGTVGGQPFAYDCEDGTAVIGAPATALGTRISEDKTPLRVRGLTAETMGDTRVALAWQPGHRGAERLQVQRAPKGGAWETIATVAADATSYEDATAVPSTAYRYQVVSANAAGTGKPSDTGEVTTWETGVKLLVEDFAGAVDAKHSFGAWQSAPAGRSFTLGKGAGSPRNAATPNGLMGIGRTGIGSQRAIYTEGIRGDFSVASAMISFDILTQDKADFGILLKLADGTWVVSGGGIDIAKREWKTTTFNIVGRQWNAANPATMTKGAKVTLTPAQLADIRGIGIWVGWVINDKWVQLDQVHVRAKDLRRE